jgi:hypothetical protein
VRSTVLAVIAGPQPRRSLRLTVVDEVVPVFESMMDALHTLIGGGRDGWEPYGRTLIPGAGSSA